jgi:altronate dehydratase
MDCRCTLQNFSEDGEYLVCTDAVCKKHVEGCKYAINTIEKGRYIYKSGVPIAKTIRSITPGEWINSDNTKPLRYENKTIELDAVTRIRIDHENNSFMGYKNPHGGVATRKKILIIGTVCCVNQTIRRLNKFLVKKLNNLGDLEILPLTHLSGCGHVAGGIDVETLGRLIDGHIRNPNCFGAVVIGLGCEDIQYNSVYTSSDKIIHLSNRQSFESEKEEFNKIYKVIRDKVSEVVAIQRTSFDIANLVIGLQCGGSDGLSGVTANPLLGSLTDAVCENGGSAILSETPELSGCREWCIKRTVTDARSKFSEIFSYWDREFSDHESNPAPGNLQGGILNVFEKSLGSVLKGGRGEISDVISYGDPIRCSGLTFMDSPGYDPCSITGQVSAGANVIIFTTGRGSNYDNGLVPVIKISSNRATYESGNEYIDFDASDYMNIPKRENLLSSLMAIVLKTCSGELRTKSEILGVEDVVFVPWQRGTTV